MLKQLPLHLKVTIIAMLIAIVNTLSNVSDSPKLSPSKYLMKGNPLSVYNLISPLNIKYTKMLRP